MEMLINLFVHNLQALYYLFLTTLWLYILWNKQNWKVSPL